MVYFFIFVVCNIILMRIFFSIFHASIKPANDSLNKRWKTVQDCRDIYLYQGGNDLKVLKKFKLFNSWEIVGWILLILIPLDVIIQIVIQ